MKKFVAILLMLVGVFTYQAPQYVLDVEVDQLLLFERIRAGMTAAILSYIALCMLGYLAGFLQKRKEHSNKR